MMVVGSVWADLAGRSAGRNPDLSALGEIPPRLAPWIAASVGIALRLYHMDGLVDGEDATRETPQLEQVAL